MKAVRLVAIIAAAISSLHTVQAKFIVPPITEIEHPAALWRFNYTAVWNETQPYYKDPVQQKLYNCWLPAASIAVTWVNPDWVSRLFFYTDGSPLHSAWFPSSDWALLSLWDPMDGSRQNFTVNAYNKSLTEDIPGGNWWHSALTQGFSQMGQLPIPPEAAEQSYRIYGIHHNNGSFWHNNGIPAVAMAMMTGKPVSKAGKGDYGDKGVGGWFEDLKHSRESPICLTTVGKEEIVQTRPVIHGNHAYAVLVAEEGEVNATAVEKWGNGTEADGSAKQENDGTQWERRVLLRNPWGSQEWYNAEDVWTNLQYLNYLTDFKKLEWVQ